MVSAWARYFSSDRGTYPTWSLFCRIPEGRVDSRSDICSLAPRLLGTGLSLTWNKLSVNYHYNRRNVSQLYVFKDYFITTLYKQWIFKMIVQQTSIGYWTPIMCLRYSSGRYVLNLTTRISLLILNRISPSWLPNVIAEGIVFKTSVRTSLLLWFQICDFKSLSLTWIKNHLIIEFNSFLLVSMK